MLLFQNSRSNLTEQSHILVFHILFYFLKTKPKKETASQKHSLMLQQNYGSEGINANLKVEVILHGNISYILYIASYLKLSNINLFMLSTSLASSKNTFRNSTDVTFTGNLFWKYCKAMIRCCFLV